MTQQTPSLQKSEWIIFCTITVLLASVFIIAKESSFRGLERISSWERKEVPSEIWVEIVGHVQRPGKYKLAMGAPLEAALRKARPKPFADLSSLNISEAPKAGQCVEVFAYQSIRVRVAGCVREVLDLQLEPGSRICDLKDKIELAPEADRAFFRKRRLLQNGEVVEIPSKHKQVCLREIKTAFRQGGSLVEQGN